jgi:nucleotide-binding universal stress UspA family protein
MPGVILTVLDHPEAAGTVLAASRRLAVLTGTTHINALLVRTPADAGMAQSEEILTAEREAELDAAEAKRAAAALVAFNAWLPATQQAGIEAEWIDVDGIAQQVVEERGRRADFVVLGQPAQNEYGTSWHAMRAALFATHRPMLVVPTAATEDFGRRVAIAWRDDEQTTKAVLAGLRCLAQAEHVFVLSGVRIGSATPAMPAILAEHGVSAELQTLSLGLGAFGPALLDKVHEVGADMLVMGAYMHSPLREFLFGGVTRHMLTHADIPVLMRH